MKPITLILLMSMLFPFAARAEPNTYAGRGALIGGGAGVLAGGITTLASCSNEGRETKGACYFILTPITVLGGGLAGAGIGALIGSGIKRKIPQAQLVVDPQTGTYGAHMSMDF